ncbi:hypothetical protein QWI30_30885 [Citrobacter freundii]|nr:hypothetical protein [Citrobacter freundii]
MSFHLQRKAELIRGWFGDDEPETNMLSLLKLQEVLEIITRAISTFVGNLGRRSVRPGEQVRPV